MPPSLVKSPLGQEKLPHEKLTPILKMYPSIQEKSRVQANSRKDAVEWEKSPPRDWKDAVAPE